MNNNKENQCRAILNNLYKTNFFGNGRILSEVLTEYTRRNNGKGTDNNTLKRHLIRMEAENILTKYNNQDTAWIRKSTYPMPREWQDTDKKKCFISYIDVDAVVKRAIAVKKSIEEKGEFMCYLAKHSLEDDANHKKSFSDLIVGAMEHMDIFVAIYNRDYWQSSYCNQEVGFALNPKQNVRVYFSVESNNQFEGKGFIQSLGIIQTTDAEVASKIAEKP